MRNADDESGGGDGGGRRIAELRTRIDGFTPERQRKFLKWLAKTGCVRDSAAKAGVSTTTVDRARREFADFDGKCRAAHELAAPNLEAIAYQRATVGAPAKIIRKGELLEVRVKPSDAMLRLLLGGAAPEKYGRARGAERLPEEERERIRREVQAELKSKLVATKPELIAKLKTMLAVLRRRMIAEGELAAPEPGMRMVPEEELKRLGWTPPAGSGSDGPGAAGGGEGGS